MLDDILVSLAEGGGLGRGRLGLPFDITDQVEEDLDRAPIRCGRAVDELGDDRRTLGDLATPASVADENPLVQRFTQQRLQVLGAGRPAAWIAGPAFRETGVAGRFAVG